MAKPDVCGPAESTGDHVSLFICLGQKELGMSLTECIDAGAT